MLKQMMKPEAFNQIPKQTLENEIVPKLMDNKKKLDVFYHQFLVDQ